MKRLLRLAGTGMAGLIALLAVGTAVVYGLSTHRLNRVYSFSDPALTIPADSASVARGKHFVQAIGKCASCHGDDLAGKVAADNFLIGRLYSANLTRGKGGIGSTYTDADYVRAIRHGVRRDGRPLAAMPTDAFYYISDDDLANSIAYLKTIPAVDAIIPPRRIGPVARALDLMTDFPLLPAESVPLNAPRPIPIPAGATREYGDYLATTGACKSCHLADLAGGVPIEKNVFSANLTPRAIGKWTEADFRKALRDGIRPNGKVLSAVMPWPYTRFMTDEEIHALWLYVHGVEPKRGRVR